MCIAEKNSFFLFTEPPKVNFSFVLNVTNRRTVPVLLQWMDEEVTQEKKIPAESKKLEVFSFSRSIEPSPVTVKIVDSATSKFVSIGGKDSFDFQPAIEGPILALVIPSKPNVSL